MTDRTAPAPLDLDAAERLWRGYVAAHPARASVVDEPPVERFGDSAELADELVDLVLHGPKRATAGLTADSAVDGDPLPRIGGRWIACDGSGAPRAVLRSVELRIGPLDSVDRAFAWDEGEGARTRDDWLRSHRATSRAPAPPAARSSTTRRRSSSSASPWCGPLPDLLFR